MTLTDFSNLTPAYFNTILASELESAKARLVHVTSQSDAPTWGNTVLDLDQATEALGHTWGLANHLQSVCDTPDLRACVNDWLPKMSDFSTQLGQDLALMARYESLQERADELNLNTEQRKVLSNALRDFVLSGAKLEQAQRALFAANEAQLAQLQQTFSEHVLDATNAFEHHCAYASDLAGLPEDELAARAAAAQSKGKHGFLITLHAPSYGPVMQYCKNRALREQLYRAYVTRASELNNAAHDNSDLMKRIVHLRGEQARLLGYDNYAEVSLQTKMAQSPAQVEGCLLDLAHKAKPSAELDLQLLKKYAREHCGIDDLQAWDLAFVSEQLRQSQYAYSDHEVKQYFQEPKVFQGLFAVIEQLFGVSFVPHDAPVWHPSVRVFTVQTRGEITGYLYVDPYARAGKRGGAWMNSFTSRVQKPDGQVQLPVALVVCNAALPVGDKPALLSHDDVTTLFHEFGHALHHLLTQVGELAVSGISGVEWDAVELPSQFMENYCWEWRVLEQLTAHVDTQASLPRDLYERMLAAKNYQAGLGMLRQVEFSLFDMRLHADPSEDANAVLARVRDEVAVNRAPSFNRFAHSFGHIFAGGYAAGYYSYKWAEVLSADAFAAFEEAQDVLSPTVGARLRDQIFAVGGSRPALDSFIAFRGRAPQPDALLRHNGLSHEAVLQHA
jgi:oligopeptidase A